MNETKVNRSESYDRLVMTVKLPSGGVLKWAINRNSETLEVSFSNDPAILKQQIKVVKDYIASLPGTNKDRQDALEKLAKQCKSGAEIINRMQLQPKIKA